MLKTHFDEIRDELRDLKQREDLLRPTVILLLWLPRLYQGLLERYDGDLVKLGFLDAYNLHGHPVSIVNAATSSHCIDFLLLARHLDVEIVIGIGLAGAFALPIGTVFLADRALSEQTLTAHFTAARHADCDPTLARRLEGLAAEIASNGRVERCTVVSLDLFARETSEFLEQYRCEVGAVDMEVAPLYIMARTLGIRAAAVMIVSDVLGHSYFLRDSAEVSVVHAVYERIIDALPKFADTASWR